VLRGIVNARHGLRGLCARPPVALPMDYRLAAFLLLMLGNIDCRLSRYMYAVAFRNPIYAYSLVVIKAMPCKDILCLNLSRHQMKPAPYILEWWLPI
jgi:hypothetical protein